MLRPIFDINYVVHMGDSAKICAFCEKENPAYTCPRCLQSYCCKTCYQDYKHISCSENFYKEWVQTCVSLNDSRPEMKTKMVEILKRVHKQSEDDSLDSDDEDSKDDIAELNERLIKQLTTSDSDDLWERLSPTDQAKMKEVLDSQEVPLWDPWWHLKIPKKLVIELGALQPSSSSMVELPECIPKLSSLTSRTPSDNVKYQVLNVLAAYVFTSRLYNGDLSENVQDTVQILCQLSSVLGSGSSFCSAAESVYSLREHKQDLGLDDRVLRLIFDDLCQLLIGPNDSRSKDFVHAALFDIHNLLCKAKDSKHQEDKRKLKLAMKKVEYLLSWSQDFGSSLSGSIPNLQFEIASLTENMQSIAKTEMQVEDKSKVKIVEIDTLYNDA